MSCMKKSALHIYKASAGSGKTFALTTEYIRLMVMEGAQEEYMHTLAVTFTNKATAEMKDRIIQHLYGIWRGMPSSDSTMKAVQDALKEHGADMDVETIRSRCAEALKAILHDYSHFRVETIDSFFLSVMRCLARELGQSSNLQVDLRDAEVASLAVDRLIDRLEEDSELQRIVMDYIHEQMESDGKWNVSKGIKRFSGQIFREDFSSRSDKEREAIHDDKRAKEFRKAMRTIRDDSEKRITDLTMQMKGEIEGIADIAEWCGKLPALTYVNNILQGKSNRATQEGKGFRAFLEDGASALKKASQGNAEAVDVMRSLGDRFNNYLKEMEVAEADCNTAALALRYTYPLQLLCRIDDEVRTINEENERIALSKTTTLLSRLVDGQDSPFVFEKIGTVLRNIMIDEFQDTSGMQWDNFRVLLFENQSLGGSDLLVGDIKQSIYRWRGGNWALLRDVSDTMREWNPVDRVLNTNWRSDRNIIEFNNGFFPGAAEKLDILDTGARFRLKDIYADVVQLVPEHRGNSGFVSLDIYCGAEVDRSEKWDKEEIQAWRMDSMLNEIKELHAQGLPLEEMAIIVRYNSQATRILEYFAANAPGEIVLSSDEAYLLENSTLVQIMICVLRMIVTDVEKNPVPMRTFLLLYYREVLKSDISTDRLMRGDAEELLPEWLRANMDELAGMPLYELLGVIYRELDLQRLNVQDAYHFAFLDCVMEYLRDNPGDIHSFLEAWDETLCHNPIPSARTRGIRILTVHKSKGLEFHTVFMPFADFRIEAESPQHETILWCEAEGEHSNEVNVLGKLPIKLSSQMENSHFAKHYDEEHLQRRVDELNSLYVAMTRASHNMYMWCETRNKWDKSGTTGDLLNEVLNAERKFDGGLFHVEVGAPVVKVDGEKSSDNRMNPVYEGHETAMVSYLPRMDFRQSSEARELFMDEDVSQRELGTICHNVLEQIRDWNDIGRVLEAAFINGMMNAGQMDELKVQLQQIEDNPVVREWFNPENRVFAECEILNPKADRHMYRCRRPDRVVMRDGVITVVDYKFGDEHDGYSRQVRDYMYLLRQIYPDTQIRGYLWYVRNAKVEEVVQ